MSLLALISTGMLIFIALAILVGLANLILGSQTYARRKYTKIASALGLSYDPEAKELRSLGCEALPALIGLKEPRNLLHGTVAEVETVFVEAKNPEVLDDPMMGGNAVPLIYFRLPGRALPAFQLINHFGKGEAVLKQLGTVCPRQYHLIELRDNPGFPNFFLLLALRQEDAEALRELFPRPVQDFFMEMRDYIGDAQGAGEWVGVVKSSVPLGVKDFQATLADARRVHELFARATGQGGGERR